MMNIASDEYASRIGRLSSYPSTKHAVDSISLRNPVGATTVTVSFWLANENERVKTINGVLRLMATDDLSDPDSWEPVGECHPTVISLGYTDDGIYEWTVDRDLEADRMFYRVRVDFPEED